MSKPLVAAVAGMLVTVEPALAQSQSGNEFSQILLSIAIVLGVLSSLYVFVLSAKMGGGGIGSALLLYGLGMLSVVVSLLSVTWLKGTFGGAAGIMHDAFFILGFVLMVFGSQRVARLFA